MCVMRPRSSSSCVPRRTESIIIGSPFFKPDGFCKKIDATPLSSTSLHSARRRGCRGSHRSCAAIFLRKVLPRASMPHHHHHHLKIPNLPHKWLETYNHKTSQQNLCQSSKHKPLDKKQNLEPRSSSFHRHNTSPTSEANQRRKKS